MPTRLTGMDAIWLSLETRTSHMHVGSVIVLDPSTASGGELTRDRVAAYIGERLHLAAPLRRRLSTVPLDLDFPVWIEDPDFDLDFHVRRAALPRPGGMGELAEFAADVMGRPLDRSRPLWEAWVVEGLEDGRVALVTKTHHAAVDGVSGAELTAAVMQRSPDEEPPPPSEPWRPEPDPGEARLLAAAGIRWATAPLRLLRTGAQAAEAVAAALRGAAGHGSGEHRRGEERAGGARGGEHGAGLRDSGPTPPPAPFAAPMTRFNGAVGPHRRVAFCQLPLGSVKDIRAAVGGTVNDVILATVAGALRRYLVRHGDAVDGPLVAMVPISVRAEHDRAPGNRVSGMLVSMPVHIEDPVERLHAVSSSTAGAKEQHGALGATTIQQVAEVLPGAVSALAARLYTRYRAADRHRPVWNVVVSNVPGPRSPLYCAGARMEAMYPLGPVHETSALNITLFSYGDTIDVGLNADRELVPDVAEVARSLESSLWDLSDLAKGAGP